MPRRHQGFRYPWLLADREDQAHRSHRLRRQDLWHPRDQLRRQDPWHRRDQLRLRGQSHQSYRLDP